MTWHTVQVVPAEWLIQDGDRVVGSIICRERRYEAEILWATGNITGSFADMASALAFVEGAEKVLAAVTYIMERPMSDNPIQDAIDTLSIPKDWRLQQITYMPTPERGTVAVAIFQPVAPDRIITIAGVGATADEALRDAQKRVWDHVDGSSRK